MKTFKIESATIIVDDEEFDLARFPLPEIIMPAVPEPYPVNIQVTIKWSGNPTFKRRRPMHVWESEAAQRLYQHIEAMRAQRMTADKEQLYTLLFNRGNGTEAWNRKFDLLDDAIREANDIAEYGNGWWFEIRQGDTVVLEGQELQRARINLDVD